MKLILLSNPAKRGIRAALLLIMLLFNLGPISIAYAAPSNDNFAGATLISGLPYTSNIDTSTAADPGDGPAVAQSCDGKLLEKGFRNVWYKYTPATSAPVNLDTLGTSYDTYIAVWKGPNISSLTLVACDDDNDASLQSQMVFNATAGITYYIEVAKFNCAPAPCTTGDPATGGGNLIFRARVPAYVSTYIGGAFMDQHIFANQSSVRQSYSGTDSGPVKVQSDTGIPIVASERVAYSPDGGTTWTSHAELMGLPNHLLSTTYYFPWYNNKNMNSQLRVANVGTTTTKVRVYIKGVLKKAYRLSPNASKRISYAGVDDGPVKIQSTGGVKIIASLRVAYTPDAGVTWPSFAEVMGLSSKQVTTAYLFPWYNNNTLNSQLRFANLGTANTNVKVYIKGVLQNSYPVPPNTSKRVAYAGVDSGPVLVVSDGQPIVASLRVAYTPDAGVTWTSFSEMMGLPQPFLSTRYSFPIYNNVDFDSQLRFANVGTAPTTVTVTVNGFLKATYKNMAPNQSMRVKYNGLNSGPVVVQSTGGVPIIVSERVQYFDGANTTSFAEMMGMPQSQLTSIYWFPWYNDLSLDTQLRYGAP